MQPDEARAALDQIHSADLKLAEKVSDCPPWRHALFGTIFAALIGSIAISSTAQYVALPFIVVGIFLIKRSDRKRKGVFVKGFRRGATLPVVLSYVAAMIGLVIAAMHMRGNGFSDVSKFGLSAIAFVLAILFSIVWNRVYRRELTGA